MHVCMYFFVHRVYNIIFSLAGPFLLLDISAHEPRYGRDSLGQCPVQTSDYGSCRVGRACRVNRIVDVSWMYRPGQGRSTVGLNMMRRLLVLLPGVEFRLPSRACHWDRLDRLDRLDRQGSSA